MRRALVLSAETPSAVATVRALHGAGFEVSVLAEHLFSPAAASWRCGQSLRVGAWRSDDLVSHVLDVDADVVVPVSEGDLLRLAPVRESVERLAPVVAPAAEALLRATDKAATGRIARDLGDERVTGPDEALLPADQKVGDVPDDDFPMVAKPRRSRTLLADDSIWGDSARFCADGYDLREAHREFAAGSQDTLAQRPVYGEALLASVLLHDDGRPALSFVHRRLREARPEGGPSACAVSHALSPELVEPAVAMAAELGLFGVPVQFEFIVPENGPSVLLDVNARPWGTLGLALDAGVDFYGVAACHALGDPLPQTPPDYQIGLVRQYLPFEVRHALAVIFGGPPAGYEGAWPASPLDAALSAAFLPSNALVFQSGDPLPALADFAHIIRRTVWKDSTG